MHIVRVTLYEQRLRIEKSSIEYDPGTAGA